MAGIGTNNFWITAWLAFLPLMAGEVHCSTSVSAELNVHRAAYAQVHASTTCAANLNGRFVLGSPVAGHADAHSTYLSAARPIGGDSQGVSDADNSYLSRRTPVESSVSDGGSLVSAHVTVNPVDIDGVSVDQSASVSGEVAVEVSLQSELFGESVVDSFLEARRGLLVDIDGTSVCSAQTNVHYALFCPVDGSTDCSAHLTVNPVELDAHLGAETVAAAELNKRIALEASVAGGSDLQLSVEVTRTLRLSGSSDSGRSSCWANLNEQHALWCVTQPKSVVSATLNAVWDLAGLLTTAPLSNTRITAILSARYETSVSVTDQRSALVLWLGKKHGVSSESFWSSTVSAKITLNPVWITGLSVFGESQVPADLNRNRSLLSSVHGASSVDSSINKHGACWSVPQGFSSVPVYLNRFGACWSVLSGASSCSAKLSADRAVSSDISCRTSVDVDSWRMRNVQSDVQCASQVVGHVTVNPRSIVDAVSTPVSVVYGQLSVAVAVETIVNGVSLVEADSQRKRNVEGVTQALSTLEGRLNLHRALWSQLLCWTDLSVHLSRRFYTQGDRVDDKTVVSAYLSAIRPLSVSVPDGRTHIDATAWRKRNLVPDLLFGVSLLTGKLVLNAVPVADAHSPEPHTLVFGDLYRRRELQVDVLVGDCLLTGALNAAYAAWSDVQCVSVAGVGLNVYYACDALVDLAATCGATLNAQRSVSVETLGSTEVDAQAFRKRALYGQVEGVSTPQGKLSVNSVEIDGVLVGGCEATADLRLHLAVQVSCAGDTLCDAEAFRKRNLQSELHGASEATAHLNRQAAMRGDSFGDSALSALLSTLRKLYAACEGSSVVYAALGVEYSVSAQVFGSSDLQGRVAFIRDLYGYCPTETSVSTNLVKNIRDLWAVSDASESSVFVDLYRLLQFISPISGDTRVHVDLNVWFALWSNLYPRTTLSAPLNARFALGSDIWSSRTALSASLSTSRVVYGAVSGQTFVFAVLSAAYAVAASVDQCRGDVSAELTINAKELDGAVGGSASVWAHLEKVRVLRASVVCRSQTDAVLSAARRLGASGACGSLVTARLNVRRACVVVISCFSGVTVRADNIRALRASSSGGTLVSGQVSVPHYPSALVEGQTSVSAVLSEKTAVAASSLGRSVVWAVLGLRGVLFGGDPFAQFTAAGSSLVSLVKDTPPTSLPDWAQVERVAYSLLSALIESIHLDVSPDLVSDLSPLSLSLYHHCSVWRASVAQEPQSVVYRMGDRWLLGSLVRRAQSLYDLIHSPVPKWYWRDGRLYVSRLALGMEQVNVVQGRFELARPVSIDRRFPVYLVWSRPRGDLFYLLDERSLRFTSGRLARVEPRFGYIIGQADTLPLGAHFGVYVVSGRAHPWLVFQSSSGDDSLPDCQPTVISLTKRGFISIQVHEDTVTLDRARGEQVYRMAEGSLSACGGLRGQLVGVFVGEVPPAVVPRAVAPGEYSPLLGQVFPVEPGARYLVPQGATRLVLGILHDGSYSAGQGWIRVSVIEYDTQGALFVVYTDPSELSPSCLLEVDGRRVSARAVSLDTNPFYRWFRLLGGVLPFAGWNGFDMRPYLQTVGVSGYVLPGIKPRVYEWDGLSPLVVSGYRVDVPGVADSVYLRFVMQGSHLPYQVDGRMFVNGRWGDVASAGDEVHACVRFWRAQVSVPGSITVSPTVHLQPLRRKYLVVSLPYEVRSLGVSPAPAGNSQRAVFVWGDDVS